MSGEIAGAGPALGDRYQLEQLLGRGGMGEVWAGRDLRLKRPVAVKILTPAGGAVGAQDLALFRREAEIGAMLNHPGITTVFDLDSYDTGGRRAWYLVMELLAGRTLAAVLRDHPTGLPVDQVVDIARQVLDALAAAHAQGVVHRDIKPANLFRLDSGRVKVGDFGISRLANATAILTGMHIVGTPPYMAPEQFSTAPVDHRCDLYAVGCVLYELLAGTPWVDLRGDLPAIMYQHVHVPPVPPSVWRPGVPGSLEQLVMDLLAKDPGSRPPDAAAALNRLGGLAGSEGPPGAGECDTRKQLLTDLATAMRAVHDRMAGQRIGGGVPNPASRGKADAPEVAADAKKPEKSSLTSDQKRAIAATAFVLVVVLGLLVGGGYAYGRTAHDAKVGDCVFYKAPDLDDNGPWDIEPCSAKWPWASEHGKVVWRIEGALLCAPSLEAKSQVLPATAHKSEVTLCLAPVP